MYSFFRNYLILGGLYCLNSINLGNFSYLGII